MESTGTWWVPDLEAFQKEGLLLDAKPAGASRGYHGDPARLDGEWSAFHSGNALSALSYEACVGTTAYGCQAAAFSAANASGSWHAWSEMQVRKTARLLSTTAFTEALTVRRVVFTFTCGWCLKRPFIENSVGQSALGTWLPLG